MSIYDYPREKERARKLIISLNSLLVLLLAFIGLWFLVSPDTLNTIREYWLEIISN